MFQIARGILALTALALVTVNRAGAQGLMFPVVIVFILTLAVGTTSTLAQTAEPSDLPVANDSWDYVIDPAATPGPEYISALAWSPDGKWLAIGHGSDRCFGYLNNYVVILEQVETGLQLEPLRLLDCPAMDIAWNRDNERLVIGTYANAARVVRITGNQVETEGSLPVHNPEGYVQNLWSPIDDRIVSIDKVGGLEVTVWTLGADRSTEILLNFSANNTDSASWSADGMQLALASRRAGIQIHDSFSGQQLQVLTPVPTYLVAWSPDGSTIAGVNEQHVIQVWDAQTGVLLRELPGHTEEVVQLRWSGDSRYLLTASRDGTIRTWDTATGESAIVEQRDEPIFATDWDPTGRWIVLPPMLRTSDGASPVIVPDPLVEALPTAMPNETTSLLVTDLDWSSDGRRIAVGFSRWQGQYQQSCGDGTDILLVDAATGQLTPLPRPNMGCSPSTVDFNPANSQILVASASTFEIWDLVTGSRMSAVERESLFQAASWSPDGTEVVVTSLAIAETRNSNFMDGRAGFLRPPDSYSSGFIYSAWGPDGERIASSMDNGRIYVWSATDSQVLATFQGHHAPVKRLAWNSVSNVIASGDDNGIIWIWDASTGQPIRQLNGHTGIVYDLAWHPNGEELASAGADNTVRVWNASSGAMRIVDSSEPFSAVAYSPDGTELAYAGAYASLATPIEIVPAPSVEPFAPAPTPPPTETPTPTPTPG